MKKEYQHYDERSFYAHNNEYETISGLEASRKHYEDYQERGLYSFLGFEDAVHNSQKTINTHVDFGCGTGWIVNNTAQAFETVIGIEPSEAAIKTAKALTAGKNNIQYKNTDMISFLREEPADTPILVTTATVLSHINNTTIEEFLSLVNKLPLGSMLYFGEPHSKNRHQYLWYIRNKEWWAKNLSNWELTFEKIAVEEYDYGITGVCVGAENVAGDNSMNYFEKVVWFVSGTPSYLKNILRTIFIMLGLKK